jgi:hypothetical protein
MKKFNWQYALGELVLIFLGITLAIAFQNWNEQKKQERLEGVVLQQLKVALDNDLQDVNANLATHNRGKKSCQKMLQILTSPGLVAPEDLLRNVMPAIDFTFLVSDISTYEYLKSVGLHIIQNDSLRRQITYLYDVVYEGIYGVENNAKPIQQDVISDLKKYFTGTPESITPYRDVNDAKNDTSLKFDLKNLEFAHGIMIRRYTQDIKPELERLIRMVDKELEE